MRKTKWLYIFIFVAVSSLIGVQTLLNPSMMTMEFGSYSFEDLRKQMLDRATVPVEPDRYDYTDMFERNRAEEKKAKENNTRTYRTNLWPSASYTSCRFMLFKPTGPTICIDVLGARQYKKSDPITANLRWYNAPEGSLVEVHLERNLPQEDGRQYLGTNAHIYTMRIGPPGDGSARFTWNGKHRICPPSDLPGHGCGGAANYGNYILRAAIYHDSADSFGIMSPLIDKQPTNFSHSKSAPFDIIAEPELRQLAEMMGSAAQRKTMPPYGSMAQIASGSRASTIQPRLAAKNMICAKIPSAAPYVSTLTACIPRKKVLNKFGELYVDDEQDIIVTVSIFLTPRSISE